MMRRARYIVGRWLIHAGLNILPDGPVRRELTALLFWWRGRVEDVLSGRSTINEAEKGQGL